MKPTKICPITLGRKKTVSRLDKISFCSYFVAKIEAGNAIPSPFNCPNCCGLPAGLTIAENAAAEMVLKNKTDEENMKKVNGTCESCGKVKRLHPSHGKQVCSNCMNLRSNINKRPEVVIATLHEMAPEAFNAMEIRFTNHLRAKYLAKFMAYQQQLDDLEKKLAEMERSEKYCLVSWPRQHGKSTIAAEVNA